MKKIFVVNGYPRSGKDTFAEILSKYVKVMKISSVIQTAEQRQTIRQAYLAQIVSGGGDTATLQIEYDFKCIEGTGDSGSFLDTPKFLTGMVADGGKKDKWTTRYMK